MTAPPITIRALLQSHAPFFYAQTWYYVDPAERFLDEPLPDDAPRESPTRLVRLGERPSTSFALGLPLAVTLVAAYLRHPFDPIWSRYLWCRDTDAKGQRIYVGGVSSLNGRKLELHRHLHLTAQFGAPTWEP